MADVFTLSTDVTDRGAQVDEDAVAEALALLTRLAVGEFSARANVVGADDDLDAIIVGLKVVAEGVETAAQAAYLRHRNCDFAQGYLFSRPLEPAAFEALLALEEPPLSAPTATSAA